MESAWPVAALGLRGTSVAQRPILPGPGDHTASQAPGVFPGVRRLSHSRDLRVEMIELRGIWLRPDVQAHQG